MLFALVMTAALAATASAQANSLCPLLKNCIPGIVVLQNGIDVVKGTQNGTEGDPKHEYLLPIFDMTYTKGYGYTNEDGTRWDVPDQVQAFSNPNLLVRANDALVENYQQWITSESKSFSFGIGVSTTCPAGNSSFCMGVNFKYNHESYQYENRMKVSGQMSSFSKMQWTHYSMESLAPPFLLPINSALSAYIALLPDAIKTDADQAMYSRLIQYWGTHISMQVDMGAYAHVSSFAESSYVEDVTEQWAASQWALNFAFELFSLLNITGHAGGFHNKSSIHVNQSFQEHTESYEFFRGGDLALVNASQSKWLASTIPIPAWVHTRLTSLSDIVPLTRPDVANNIDATVNYYLKHGKLPTSPVDSVLDTYPRGVDYYKANWPAFFAAHGGADAMPADHEVALRRAGRLA